MTREEMLAEISLERLAGSSGKGEHGDSFRQVAGFVAGRRSDDARAVLRALLAKDGLSSVQKLQVWSVLRELGEPLISSPASPLGLVVEVGLAAGLDVLGVYDDGSAMYINYSGRRAVWRRPTSSRAVLVRPVLEMARSLSAYMGPPWDGAKRAAPVIGEVRLNVLTASGLQFGEGPHDEIARHTMAGPLLSAATNLMVELTRSSD